MARATGCIKFYWGMVPVHTAISGEGFGNEVCPGGRSCRSLVWLCQCAWIGSRAYSNDRKEVVGMGVAVCCSGRGGCPSPDPLLPAHRPPHKLCFVIFRVHKSDPFCQ